MYQTWPAETNDEANLLGYAETDPSGRYGRFRDILGKGAMKTVYRAFDEVLGMEVAWNQVKLNHVFKSPDEMQRLYSEVHLLKNLDHDSIIRFHTSWIDVDRRTFNFIAEMFTSGTLREYRHKYKQVNIRAIKNWSRQILEGLAYLHGHDPPVIHRDLKCDNIFVNGHLGQVKIGDLGLAAILRGSHHAHSVIGTPEFMAPELYDEEYDELVDIYSFGMCVLEMLTSEYPYSECSNPAQIYKKVTSGKLPKAFYRVHDVEARRFIGKCLESASERPSARELLMDPFLALEEDDKQLPISSKVPCDAKLQKMPPGDDPRRTTDMTITGTMNTEDDTIFLKVQISSEDGQARNIYFPFDISSDTALDVAREMVKELEITDWDPMEIAEMIDEEISALVPSWKDWGSQFNQQHSFDYDEDDDDTTQPPFYSFSSHSSSHASLPGLPTFCEASFHPMISGHDWPLEDWNNYDDTSSQSSLNSYKFSNLTFSDREQELEEDSKIGELGKTGKCTRFCPEVSLSRNCSKNQNVFVKTENACRSNREQKMTRVLSLVDLRSQLLHRSLVEEIKKRRLFKTVGAMENIGYHDPGEFSDNPLAKCGLGRSVRNLSRQGFEW